MSLLKNYKQRSKNELLVVNCETALTIVENINEYSVENIANRINELKKSSSENKYEMSRLVYICIKENNSDKTTKEKLQELTGLKREQIRKMRLVGEYCAVISKSCYSSGNYEKLGFEKVYSISKLKDHSKCETLENYVIENNISERILRQMIKYMSPLKELDIEFVYEITLKKLDEIKERKAKQKNAKAEFEKLQEELKQKDERIKQLEEELQKHKSQVNNTVGNATETIEAVSSSVEDNISENIGG